MKLLDAVNTILPYLGEANVTSTTARNTTVQSILQQIETAKRALLATGWWFNTVSVTLYPGSDLKIKAPVNVLNWECNDDSVLSEIRGEYLYNLETGTYEFSGVQTGTIKQDLDFEELPEYAAQVIMYTACTAVYSADLGVDNTYGMEILSKLAQARMYLERDHLRKKNVFVRGKRATGYYMSKLRT